MLVFASFQNVDPKNGFKPYIVYYENQNIRGSFYIEVKHINTRADFIEVQTYVAKQLGQEITITNIQRLPI